MPIHRVPGPPRVILSDIEGTETLFEVLLMAIPSAEWRAAFVRPPARLTSVRYAPDVGRVTVQKGAIHFRTAPLQLDRVAAADRPLDRLRQLGGGGVSDRKCEQLQARTRAGRLRLLGGADDDHPRRSCRRRCRD